jgi:hypothetical protein
MVILKVRSYTADAVFTMLMIFSRTASVEANDAVYVQSVAIPIKATLPSVGQPAVDPIVARRLPFPIRPL